jgi:hypothetical protein
MVQKMPMRRKLDDDVKTLRVVRHSVRLILELAWVHSDEWDKLEVQLHAVENAAQDGSTASRAAVRAAIRNVERFRASLHPNWALDRSRSSNAAVWGTVHSTSS